MGRFSSFQRQLNLYDFTRIGGGVDKGAYSHPMFIHGQYQLTLSMKRNKIKGVKAAKAAKVPVPYDEGSSSGHEHDEETPREAAKA
jgi:HSF-type DNA-binding